MLIPRIVRNSPESLLWSLKVDSPLIFTALRSCFSRRETETRTATQRSRKSTHMWRGLLNVCQLNCRSITTENRRVEVEEALMKIRFDVVGLCETWMVGSCQALLRMSGFMLYYSGGQHTRKGVDFIVVAHLIKNVYQFTPINDRCCTLEIRTDRFTLCLVMGYAPTSEASDQDYESFLSCLQKSCNRFCGPTTRFGLHNRAGRKSTGMGQVNSGQTAPPRNSRKCTILLGDFNASVGTRAHPQASCRTLWLRYS